MNTITNLTSKQLRLAADLKDQIESLEQELGQILGFSTTTTTPAAPAEPQKRRKVSAAGKARMAAAQRARWAKLKGTKLPVETLPVKPVKKAKRTMSPAARARISLLAKARWAKAKRAGKSRL